PQSHPSPSPASPPSNLGSARTKRNRSGALSAIDGNVRLDRLRHEALLVGLMVEPIFILGRRTLLAPVDDLGVERHGRYPGNAPFVLRRLADGLVLVARHLEPRQPREVEVGQHVAAR